MSESTSKSTSGGQPFDVNDEDAQKIRSKYGRFRILIIGRANAGKTTILHKICNTTDNPVVYDVNGEEIDPSVLEASASRGLHNIENEMIFKSNPGFVFHDSRGFEAGGVEELDKVKAFIESRSNETNLARKLHAIWYCIPVDDSRPFTTAENWFFSECGTGDVPAIVIFTKFDALDIKAFAALKSEGKSRIEAKESAAQHAITSFEGSQLNTLYEFAYPPKGHVYLRNMNKGEPDCSELMKQTAEGLDNEALLRLFVSTQRNNLKLCIKYGLTKAECIEIERDISNTFVMETKTKDMVENIMAWFPQFPRLNLLDLYRDYYRDYLDRDLDYRDDLDRRDYYYYRDRLDRDLDYRDDGRYYYIDLNNTADKYYSRLFSQAQKLNTTQCLIQIAITTAVLADFGFLLWDHYLDHLKVIDLYEQRPSIRDAISKAVNEAFQAFNYSRKDTGAKKQLSEWMVQIALNNRLPTELLKDPIITGEGEK